MMHTQGWGRIVAGSILSITTGLGSRLLELVTDLETLTIMSAWIGIGTGCLTLVLLSVKVSRQLRGKE